MRLESKHANSHIESTNKRLEQQNLELKHLRSQNREYQVELQHHEAESKEMNEKLIEHDVDFNRLNVQVRNLTDQRNLYIKGSEEKDRDLEHLNKKFSRNKEKLGN